jgi:hypothetical protein
MPGRSADRYCKTIRRKLAGQYHRIDGAGTELGGVVIVLYRFDDECHVSHITVRTPIAYRKPFSKLKRNLDRPGLSLRVNCARQLSDLSEKITPRTSRY